MFWSGGKDSALALWRIMQQGQFTVKHLIVTINEPLGRVSMHGVRVELVEQQAAAIGIPIKWMPVPTAPDNTAYEVALTEVFEWLKREGIHQVVYGDIFLEDLKLYRDNLLTKAGITGIYPLWKENTQLLAREMIEVGIETMLVCVDGSKLPATFAGRLLDDKLLTEMPTNVDPCGENGEFHTFVFNAPYFAHAIPIAPGELVSKQYAGSQYVFWFLDVLPR